MTSDRVELSAEARADLDGPVVTLTSGAQCRRWFVHPVVILCERSLGAVFILNFHHYARAPLGR